MTAWVGVWLLLAAWTGTAQTPEFLVENWKAADGLPSSHVVGLARTQDGFLWVGTNRGVARFDGGQFHLLTHGNLIDLRSENIQKLAAGPDCALYIGTWGGGFTVLNHGRTRSFGRPEGMKSNVVQSILPVGADEAWFGTNTGNLFHYRNGSITEVGSASLPGAAIYGLAKAPDSTLWIGTGNGLFYLNHDTVSRYHPKVPLPSTRIFDVTVTEAGSIFVASDRGLLQIQGDHWSSWTTKNGLPSDRVQVLSQAAEDVLWIGTDLGLAQLVNGRARPIEAAACSVMTLLFDSEKSLWVGCEEGSGLVRLRQPPVRLMSLAGKLDWVTTWSLAQDKAGAVWMATTHGLVRWQNNRSKLYTRKDGLPTDNIYAVSLAPDDSIWIGTEDGFAHMQKGKIGSFRTQGPGPEDPILSIAQDHSGTLWVGAARGLLRRREGETAMEEVPNARGTVWSIREDRAGNIWAATKNHGLIRLAGDSQLQFTTGCGLASNMVYDTAELSNGDIWVASEGGLTRIRNGECRNIVAENGLPPGRIVAVNSDSHDHLWLKTSTVVVAVAIAEANRVVERGGLLTGVRFFGADDGLRDQPIGATLNSVLRHTSGEVWFAAHGGVGRIDPAVLKTPLPTLQPRVDALVSEAGEHDLARPVLLMPGDQRLQFTYSAPSLIGAKTRDFRYRLTGFDQVWRDGGVQRDAIYTSLPPGRYQFQVSVRRPFEAWSNASPPLEFRVLPHFYQTWWWYVLLALASIAVILLGYHLRLVTVRRQDAALVTERLRERSRLACELHDTLARGMVGIHIQIEAAQVLLEVEPKSIRSHLENVERIAREAALETRKSIMALRSEAGEDLYCLLREAASKFSRSSAIQMAANLSGSLPQFSHEMSHEIYRFVEEALANVQLHSEAQHAYMTAYTSGNAFLLEVRDDGTGFNVDDSRDTVAGRFGITGMRERARRINGRVQINSGLGQGTRVLLEVPLLGSWDSTLSVRSRSILSSSRNFYNTLRVKLRT